MRVQQEARHRPPHESVTSFRPTLELRYLPASWRACEAGQDPLTPSLSHSGSMEKHAGDPTQGWLIPRLGNERAVQLPLPEVVCFLS